ncbi:MAG: hypothetical protein AAB364_01725 [Patescibacteria group bacterium]
MDGTQALLGPADLTFTIYNAPTGGAVIGTPDSIASVPVTNGVINTLFTVQVASFAGGSDRYLELSVDGNAVSPRIQFVWVPYAVYAATVPNNLVLGQTSAPGSLVIKNGANVDVIFLDGINGVVNVFSANGTLLAGLRNNAGSGKVFACDSAGQETVTLDGSSGWLTCKGLTITGP